jgi:hypothetical protein
MWLFYFTLFSAETSFTVLVYEVSDDGLQMSLVYFRGRCYS